MKGIIVFDDRSDIAFYTLDKELEKYMYDRIRQLEEAHGAKAEESPHQRDMRDILGAFFLPFNTSFGVLNSLKKPVLAITGENGFLIVFRKFGECVFIAVSGNGEETEETLTRKLYVFNRIVGLLYGPVESRMNSNDTAERKLAWEKLSGLMKTYERLYSSDQVFLLEAVEHVQFGQLQAAQEVVVGLVRECLDHSKNGGLPNVQHAMLLVDTKLLTICGRSPQIPTADILLMTLFVSNFYHEQAPQREEEQERSLFDVAAEEPREDRAGTSEQTFPMEMEPNESLPLGVERQDDLPVPLGVERQDDLPVPLGVERQDDLPVPLGVERQDDLPEEESDEVQETDSTFVTPYQTPRSTPAGAGMTSEIAADLPFDRDPEDPPFSIQRESAVDVEDVQFQNKGFPAKLRNALFQFGGFGRRHAAYADDASDLLTSPLDKAKFMEQRVFLQPHQGHFIPHTLHCLEVYHGIVLVLITEFSGSQLAGTICQTLINLGNVFNSSRSSLSGGQSTFDILEDALRRIYDLVKREVQATAGANSGLRQWNMKVMNVWSTLKSAGFRSFLERGGHNPTEDPRFTRLEAYGRDLMDKLVKLFEQLYFTPKQQEYDTNHVISRLMRNFASLKRDYGEFLALKGIMNIPMVSFALSFPGMVHFVLIDRSFDEMTTPSLCPDNNVGIPYVEQLAQKRGEGAGTFLRRKIWAMVQRAQKFLALGYTSQTWLDKDFLYSYYLWINIPNNALGSPIRFCSPNIIRASDSSPPGVIGTYFYKDLYHNDIQSQGYVYELYCIHEPSVPIKVASLQCRTLAEQLWPTTKEAIAPFSLIN